jgi:hypothetical protein
MSMTRIVTALLALSMLAACKGKSAEPSEPAPAAASAGDEEEVKLTPDEAMQLFRGMFAPEVCKPEGYFASCVNFAEGECIQLTNESLEACAKENPAWLEKMNEASGQALGMCTAKRALLKVAGEGRLSIEGKCEDPESFP